jgi:hypothetical protein
MTWYISGPLPSVDVNWVCNGTLKLWRCLPDWTQIPPAGAQSYRLPTSRGCWSLGSPALLIDCLQIRGFHDPLLFGELLDDSLNSGIYSSYTYWFILKGYNSEIVNRRNAEDKVREVGWCGTPMPSKCTTSLAPHCACSPGVLVSHCLGVLGSFPYRGTID